MGKGAITPALGTVVVFILGHKQHIGRGSTRVEEVQNSYYSRAHVFRRPFFTHFV